MITTTERRGRKRDKKRIENIRKRRRRLDERESRGRKN